LFEIYKGYTLYFYLNLWLNFFIKY